MIVGLRIQRVQPTDRAMTLLGYVFGLRDHAARASDGVGDMSGRQTWRGIAVASSAFRTSSAGRGEPFRTQLDMFCWEVPMAAANFDWLPPKGSAAIARAIG